MRSLPVERSTSYCCESLRSVAQSGFPSTADWERCVPVELVDTVTGRPPHQSTEVRFGWSPKYLHIRFICQDDHVVSDFTERDQPLYEQDVVELFIDEQGDGRNYIELEVSPHNVIFDALIHNNSEGSELKADKTWQLEGLQTAVEVDRQGHRVYVIHIPASNFKSPLTKGVCWRVNVYRIDENMQGDREYQAWQPTGAVNFHLPARFGHFQLG